LEKALSLGFKAKGPFIIDCSIGKDELVLPTLAPGDSVGDIIVKADE